MVLGKLPVPGCPTIWMIVGQGPSALAVGAGGVVWTFLLSSLLSPLFLYSPLFLFSSLSISLGDGPIRTEILSQRVVKPKTTHQLNLINKLAGGAKNRKTCIICFKCYLLLNSWANMIQTSQECCLDGSLPE